MSTSLVVIETTTAAPSKGAVCNFLSGVKSSMLTSIEKVKTGMAIRDANKALNMFYSQFENLKQNKVPAGDARYSLLCNRVSCTIRELSVLRECSVAEIFLERPEFDEMSKYQFPDDSYNQNPKRIIRWAFVILVGSAIACAAWSDLFHLLTIHAK